MNTNCPRCCKAMKVVTHPKQYEGKYYCSTVCVIKANGGLRKHKEKEA